MMKQVYESRMTQDRLSYLDRMIRDNGPLTYTKVDDLSRGFIAGWLAGERARIEQEKQNR